MKSTVPDLLDKLVALGDHEHIALALSEQGIRGIPLSPDRCVIAEYLIKETSDPHILVDPGRTDVLGAVHTSGGGLITLPATLGEFARKFDQREFPGLELGWRTS